jgi:ATP dependent DNA ligase domain
MVQRGILKPKPRPRFVEPMECKRVSKLPEGKDWVYEIKQDGYRAIGLVDGSSAMLYSMSGQNYTSDFPHIAFALKNLRRGNLVLDGEIVALDARGRASFQELRTGERAASPSSFMFLMYSTSMDATRSISRCTNVEGYSTNSAHTSPTHSVSTHYSGRIFPRSFNR